MAERFVGIDVALREHRIAVLDRDGEAVGPSFTIAASTDGVTTLLRTLDARAATAAQTLIGLEASGHLWETLEAALVGAGYRVLVLNPLQTRRYRDVVRRKAKTDDIDAHVIAGLLRSGAAQAAERMFGWPAPMAIGKHITLIVPEDRRAEEDDVLARLRRGERIDHFETVRVARDGRLIDVSLTVSPVRDGFGRIVGASKVARDVSERRRLDEYRDVLLKHEHEARTAAEALIRAKDQFLATISHELRTPLNAIFGWARLLEKPELDERSRKRAITAIVSGATAQARLVEDLLDLSRVVTGRLRLDVESISLREVVEAALDTVRPAASAKQIELLATLDEVSLMQGARDRLQQVVWNLVANAVKFTPRGGRIDVELRRVGDYAELIVRDNGEGISPKLLPHVFQEFWQEDSSITRAHQGMGLGLTLVKHLVELHGGCVRAESSGKGHGATFTVTLPLTA